MKLGIAYHWLEAAYQIFVKKTNLSRISHLKWFRSQSADDQLDTDWRNTNWRSYTGARCWSCSGAESRLCWLSCPALVSPWFLLRFWAGRWWMVVLRWWDEWPVLLAGPAGLQSCYRPSDATARPASDLVATF